MTANSTNILKIKSKFKKSNPLNIILIMTVYQKLNGNKNITFCKLDHFMAIRKVIVQLRNGLAYKKEWVYAVQKRLIKPATESSCSKLLYVTICIFR